MELHFPLLLSLLTVAASSANAVTFEPFCPEIGFNYVFNKYEIVAPLKTSVVDLRARPASKSSDIEVVYNGNNRIRLLCNTYERCWQLKGALVSNPGLLPQSLAFFSKELQETRVARLPSEGLVRRSCDSGWKVFIRRVDGSLSFAQNFKTYERGFGDVSGNFWMGLRNLHAATVTGALHTPLGCRVRIRAVGNDNRRYNGEYASFQVLDASEGYRLVWRNKLKGPFPSSVHENGWRFTAYDLDRDGIKTNCSKVRGYGGWWFRACAQFSFTGRYTKRLLYRQDSYQFIYAVVDATDKAVTMRSVVAEFKCE